MTPLMKAWLVALEMRFRALIAGAAAPANRCRSTATATNLLADFPHVTPVDGINAFISHLKHLVNASF